MGLMELTSNINTKRLPQNIAYVILRTVSYTVIYEHERNNAPHSVLTAGSTVFSTTLIAEVASITCYPATLAS